jgi:hypothetical protein
MLAAAARARCPASGGSGSVASVPSVTSALARGGGERGRAGGIQLFFDPAAKANYRGGVNPLHPVADRNAARLDDGKDENSTFDARHSRLARS